MIQVDLVAVILSVTNNSPRVLTLSNVAGQQATASRLPNGPLQPGQHKTLEKGLRDWVLQQTNIELGYVEQLYTFGDLERKQTQPAGNDRYLSVAYLALTKEAEFLPTGTVNWKPIYHFLPWENWREGTPEILSSHLLRELKHWQTRVAATDTRLERRNRIHHYFSTSGMPWDAELALERYELLYEAGLVSESGGLDTPLLTPPAMASDHRRILATALGRIRGKLKYRPLVFELLDETFTLLELQRVVEAINGGSLHQQNFRRLVENAGLVEGTGETNHSGRGRPAELFRFRKEVLREKAQPGVRIQSSLNAAIRQ